MGRPSRQQIETGQAFEHTDRAGNRLQITDSFSAPLLEFAVQQPEKGRRRAVLDHEAVVALYDYLDQWLIRFPPG